MDISQPVELSSADGQQLLKDVISHKTGCCYQPKLHSVFTKQKGNTTCGMVTCCQILSAYHLLADDKAVCPAFTEDNIYNFKETGSIITREKLSNDGMNIDEVCRLLIAHGCRNVKKVHAADCTVKQFRDDIIDALSRSDSSKAVIVNFYMNAVYARQDFPWGHHSPLAAYHGPADRVLILDTWPSAAECWAGVDQLLSAMNTIDCETGKTRGYCIVDF